MSLAKTETVLNSIRSLGRQVIPVGGQLWLYGSRARGDNRPDSDWYLLVLLDKPQRAFSDFDNYSFPFIELGASLGQTISAHTYTVSEWNSMSFTPFYHNVERDRKVLV